MKFFNRNSLSLNMFADTESIFHTVFVDICARYGKTFSVETGLRILGSTERRAFDITVKDCELPISIEEFATQWKELSSKRLQDTKLLPGRVLFDSHSLFEFV